MTSIKLDLHASVILLTILWSCMAGAQITEAKLIASDGDEMDMFGNAVSISGDFALIGSFLDDAHGDDGGSAYVFHYDGSTWIEETRLTASDAAPDDNFGVSVSLFEDYAVIGAYSDDNANGTDAGAAYVFHYDGVNWVEQAKLTASDGATTDKFGYSVSLSGTFALIGADLNDANGTDAGAAYVFHYDGVNWVEQAKLTASDGAALDYFGFSVSLSGDYGLIGAWKDDDRGTDAGAAYIFHRVGSNWVEEAKLTAGDGARYDYFGISVSLSGRGAAIGAYFDDNANGLNAGAAYIFHYNGLKWIEQAKLIASNGRDSDWFGDRLSLSGDYIVIASPLDDNVNGQDAGSASIFRYDGSNWVEQSKRFASDGQNYDEFGSSVSLSGSNVLVGARGADDNGYDAGAAYIYSAGMAKDESESSETRPNEMVLSNYPNPFNPTTSIAYSIGETGPVRLTIYNTLGQLVITLVDYSSHPAGQFTARFNASGLASGVYLYRLETSGATEVKRMLLTK